MTFDIKLESRGKLDFSKLTKEEKALRREASRKASMANKRLQRLEEQGLVNTPAYRSWFEAGGVKFGVRGKTQREVQYEMARLDRFLEMQTSTVRGAKKNLRNIAERVGIYNWENYKDLEQQINEYYYLQRKVLEYSRNIKEIGTSLNYEKVGEVVADYLEEVDGVISDTGDEVVEITQRVIEAISREKMTEELERLQQSVINMIEG